MVKRFVDVPADRLLASLREVGDAVTLSGGRYEERVQGREVVFSVHTPSGLARVDVYTSLAAGAGEARDCGEDAVRIVALTTGTEPEGPGSPLRRPCRARPLVASIRVYRTAPALDADRVGTFLVRLRDRLRVAYRVAVAVRACSGCGRPSRRREGRNGPFMACTGFPVCRVTVSLPGSQERLPLGNRPSTP